MAKRTQAAARLQLDPAAKRALDTLCERRGMTQIAMLARLVSWFGKQDEVVQASVLGLLSDEALADLAHVLVQREAAGSSSDART